MDTTGPDGSIPDPDGPRSDAEAGAGPGALPLEGSHLGDGLDPPGDADVDIDGDDEAVPHDPLRFSQWMKRSATGAVLSGIALGLQQALERKREVPAYVMEAPGEPEDPDAPITLHFDPDDPTKTVAVIRTPRSDPRRAPEA